MADGFRMTAYSRDMKLAKYDVKSEPRMIEAMDIAIAEVQEHIRAGHPKVSKDTMRLANRAMSQGEILDNFRERTGLASKEFSGMLRWLTHTGVTRNSVQIEQAHVVRSGFSRGVIAKVFSAQKHINDLEFGTATRRAFPAFRPALIAKGPRVNHLMRDALLRTAADL